MRYFLFFITIFSLLLIFQVGCKDEKKNEVEKTVPAEVKTLCAKVCPKFVSCKMVTDVKECLDGCERDYLKDEAEWKDDYKSWEKKLGDPCP